MAGVFINIPGVGNVEAQGAASEATLRELLAAMRGGGGGRGGAGGVIIGGGAGGGGGGGGLLGSAAGMIGKSFNKLGIVAGFATGVVGKLAGGAMKATAATIGMGEAITGAVQALSQLDGSASGVANIFKNIPLIGPVFAAVAGAADDVVKSYQAVSQSGATFGGSISKFAAASSQAGMTMAEFSGLIAKNSQAMGAFGTTTEGGAANFARVSKQLRATGSDLYALGFSTAEINQGLASYGNLMKLQGLQGKKSNAELAQGAKSYLKEMDLLAKATGQSRAEIEKSREAMAKDAQFQASMAGLGEGVRNSFMSVTDGLQDTGLKNFAKDLMATGTATTEENQKLMAMMPQSAAMLQRMNQKMQRGEAVTLEERNALNNMMKSEGGKQLQSIKYAASANAELGGLTNSLTATQALNKNALLEATEEQKKAAAETDKMNQKMAQFQQAIAEVSNNFKMLLANSGILDVMIQAFHGLVGLANQYLVPAFNIVASAVMKVANGISILLQPALDYLGEKFGVDGLAGTAQFLDDVLNAVFPILAGAMRGAIIAFDGLWNGITAVFNPLKELYIKIFGVSDSTSKFSDILIEAGAYIGDVFEILGKALGFVIDLITPILVPAIKGLIEGFKFLWSGVRTIMYKLLNFGDVIQDVGMFFDSMFDMILRGINKFTLGLKGISEEEYNAREAQRKKQQEAYDKERKARDAARLGSQENVEKQKQLAKEDAKKFGQRTITHNQLTASAQREAAAKEAAVKAQEKLLDYTAGPEELLKQFSSKQGGAVEIGIKKGEISKEKEAADKELAAAKTGAEKKAAAEKIEAAEAKLKALSEAEALAKQRASTAPAAAANADATKKAIEAEAEKKKQDDAAAKKKAEDDAAAKKKADEDANKKKDDGAKKPESSETLLAELNTKMATLLKYTWTVANNTNETVNATRGLTKDLFKSL